MPTHVTTDRLLALRMAVLGLTSQAPSPRPEGAPERVASTARRMLATQGQDWRSARWALGVRTPGATVSDVHAGFTNGLIVRSWPMRGTIHVVAAEDIGWIQQLTNRRVLAGAPKRRATLQLSDRELERLVSVSLAALAGGVALDRDALAQTWTDAGISWQSGWRYHVIWWLCQNGWATFGPVRDSGEPLLVRTDEWILAPRHLTGDDALAELATRYAAARGPITDKDLAWWAGLTLTQARNALRLAGDAGRLSDAAFELEPGNRYWAAPEAWEAEHQEFAPSTGGEDRWWLLPAFDEHLLGYTDRRPQLAPEQLDHIVPGRNGMFRATAVTNGRVRATWRRSTRGPEQLEITPLPGAHVTTGALTQAASEWARFHELSTPPGIALNEPAGDVKV